ncbi:MAG: hypothetical protein R3E01_33760 [Pirellulaceae bacterium]|nr:hypothetical protein [Planctomycetales bacterium]
MLTTNNTSIALLLIILSSTGIGTAARAVGVALPEENHLSCITEGITFETGFAARYPWADISRFRDASQFGTGIIETNEDWLNIWEGLGSDNVAPSIDFASSFVVYSHNTDYLNTLSICVNEPDVQGIADVHVSATLTAHPIDSFAYWSAIAIPRQGIDGVRIDGTELFLRSVPEPRGLISLVGVLTAIGALNRQRLTQRELLRLSSN